MIKKIKSIRNFGVFNKYQTDPSLSEFNKYNLIYGWNASGKTTISRLLRCFELKMIHGDFPKAEFQLQIEDGALLDHENLDKISNIRVFNKDFIDESIFTEGGKVKPIYYIGKEDIEKKKKLENLKKEEENIKNQINSEEDILEQKKKEKEKLSKEKSSQIKEFLRTEGKDIYTNYDKSHFYKNIETLNKEIIQSNILNEEELDRKWKAIKQTVKKEIPLLKEQILYDKDNIGGINKEQTLYGEDGIGDINKEQILYDEDDIEDINKVLQTEVVSVTIEKLKNNKTLNQWVKTGLDLYNQSDESVCDFCEQPMPEKRIEALKKHFSQNYQNLMSKVENLKKSWESKKIKTETLNKDTLYDDLSSSFEKEKNKLDEEIKKYNKFIDKVLKQLGKKEKNPFQKFEKINYEDFEIKNLIKNTNNIILQHNKKTTNFSEQRLKEKKNIEKHFLSESYKEYQDLKNKSGDLKKTVTNLKVKDTKIKIEIKQLSHTRRDYKITAQTINKKLKNFLCREELIFEAIEKEDVGYYIKRSSSGEFAKSLSEGEKTAIALICFLSKLKEENFDLKKGIVVIDDPISSLDSNSIFQAFGFIKVEIKQAEQVFILTHNFDFFKHVKHWFERDYINEKENRRETEFFMIKNFYEKEKRMARLSPLDNLLQKYNTEYQYLFKLLYTSKDMESLEEVYPLPNVARKFMETFLSFKFPEETNHDKLFSKARKETKFDSGKIERIKRFINAHSHADIDGMTSWDISQWSEGKPVIQDILDLVKRLDEKHYEGLHKISKK